ncbi:transcriptional repressor [Heliobacterium gestii]|uniref:Transcriptional repressor n=1 Tax=Heliomicrobium gestii TaxID=2699 RepID=A0A845LAZ6_HELGE|nr:transcriptional repressor [Heliomicrobium gestii]MBM7867505.1 Fe2+ or Zn2+ uptake regulation protein [Heliomicrobium gestii]MZP43947.1 transcriptional repressor [Heliomicrobium gestii]
MGAIGPRMTRQKSLVLEIVQGTTCHPTADWVYQEARQQIPDISLGTVYRNLNALVQQGLIREMTYAGASSRYDGNVENHCHFICENCQGVFDIFIEPPEPWVRQAEENSGHDIKGHRIEFFGRCAECRKAVSM